MNNQGIKKIKRINVNMKYKLLKIKTNKCKNRN